MIVFYILYSIIFVRYNTTGAVLFDAVVELKPYVAFAVIACSGVKLNALQKQVLRLVAIANVAIAFLSAFGGNTVVMAVNGHPAFLGATIYMGSLVFLLTSIDSDGNVSKRDMTVCIVMILCGLVCTRSKYYGECVLSLYFLLIYRPGMFSNLNIRHFAVLGAVLIIFVGVGWSKFDYYFISGNMDTTRFDPEAIESFARPVLYATGGLILIDHFPFGSGLASFASISSADPYSGIYHEYGIDKVYGLSEAKPDFICDAYYPLLAQFGMVGFVLFILFWVYVCQKLKRMYRINRSRFKYEYIIGTLIVCYVLIECIAGTMFAQSHGVFAMMLLGYVCGQGAKIRDEQNEEKLELQSVTKKYI